MNLLHRLRRIIGLAALAFALAGCSTIKLGYNNVDELALWWLDGYADLQDDQEARAREDLRRLHHWHRANELPKFSALLRGMEEAAPSDISPAQACGFYARIRERIDAIADRAESSAVTLAMSLTPEQLKFLQRKYDRNNAKFRKDWVTLTPQELVDKRLDMLMDRTEMIYGRLDDAQQAAMRRQLQTSSFDPQRTYAERLRRQRDTLETLRALIGQQVSLAEARTQVRALANRMLTPGSSTDKAMQQGVIEEGCRTYSVLHNSTTPAQREAAVRRLRAWQRDLTELAAQR